MNDLHNHACVPCRTGGAMVDEKTIDQYRQQIPSWSVSEIDGVQRLTRSYRFKTFKQALEFSNRVGEIAEREQHHPVLVTEWGNVTVSWWTHKIGGLHINDFIMAAKTDLLFEESGK